MTYEFNKYMALCQEMQKQEFWVSEKLFEYFRKQKNSMVLLFEIWIKK